jgi:hypothetical protein
MLGYPPWMGDPTSTHATDHKHVMQLSWQHRHGQKHGPRITYSSKLCQQRYQQGASHTAPSTFTKVHEQMSPGAALKGVDSTMRHSPAHQGQQTSICRPPVGWSHQTVT